MSIGLTQTENCVSQELNFWLLLDFFAANYSVSSTWRWALVVTLVTMYYWLPSCQVPGHWNYHPSPPSHHCLVNIVNKKRIFQVWKDFKSIEKLSLTICKILFLQMSSLGSNLCVLKANNTNINSESIKRVTIALSICHLLHTDKMNHHWWTWWDERGEPWLMGFCWSGESWGLFLRESRHIKVKVKLINQSWKSWAPCLEMCCSVRAGGLQASVDPNIKWFSDVGQGFKHTIRII